MKKVFFVPNNCNKNFETQTNSQNQTIMTSAYVEIQMQKVHFRIAVFYDLVNPDLIFKLPLKFCECDFIKNT